MTYYNSSNYLRSRCWRQYDKYRLKVGIRAHNSMMVLQSQLFRIRIKPTLLGYINLVCHLHQFLVHLGIIMISRRDRVNDLVLSYQWI